MIALYVAVAASMIYIMYNVTEFTKNILYAILYVGGGFIVIAVIVLLLYAFYQFFYLIGHLLCVRTKLSSLLIMIVDACRKFSMCRRVKKANGANVMNDNLKK